MPGYGYPRSLRLLTGGDFKRVFDQAEIKVSESQLLILARSNAQSRPRLGFVFSKKNIRRAVNRNRVKRIIRESFRLHQHQLPDYDLVILARKGLDTLEQEQLSQLITRSWTRLIKRANKANNLR